MRLCGSHAEKYVIGMHPYAARELQISGKEFNFPVVDFLALLLLFVYCRRGEETDLFSFVTPLPRKLMPFSVLVFLPYPLREFVVF